MARIGGLNIRLEVDGTGPPLVLLHGLGCSGRYFDLLRPQLRNTFTLYIPDLPGHGRSDKPAHAMWQLRDLTDWVACFIAEVGLTTPLVVGHSLGGGIAVDLAVRYPEALQGTVALAPTGIPNMPSLAGQVLRLMVDSVREPLRLYPLILPAYLRAGPRRIASLAIDETQYGHWKGKGGLKRPLLLVRGSRDPIVTDAMLAGVVSEARTVSSLEVPGAAHALHVSHPIAVGTMIRDFARSLGPSWRVSSLLNGLPMR
jgi:pimeloyl-ACP methyl ester carboxylesterase